MAQCQCETPNRNKVDICFISGNVTANFDLNSDRPREPQLQLIGRCLFLTRLATVVVNGQ